MFDGKERINVVDEINVANYLVLKQYLSQGTQGNHSSSQKEKREAEETA